MIYLNCGNLWTDEYLDKVIMLNKAHEGVIQVRSLFGSLAGFTPTARSQDRLPKIDYDEAREYCLKAYRNDISIRYTLNNSCIGSTQSFHDEWEMRLEANVNWLHSVCGVREWTITSPLLMELLRDMFPRDFLEVSTIAEVATPTDALRWKSIGADAVNLSTAINRDFEKIRGIKKILQVCILANEACLYRCPWRTECYNLSSHDSQRSEELFNHYPFRRCNVIREANPSEWLRSRMIMPQWMDTYVDETGVNWFKIAYRTHPIEVAMPILEAYMNKTYSGSYCDMWPTVAKLAQTADPGKEVNIPCDKLDNFLKPWLAGYNCDEHVCGLDCSYCDTATSVNLEKAA